MNRTLTQCSVAISRLDGIGMGYIMSTGIGFFFLSGLLIILKEALAHSEDFKPKVYYQMIIDF